MAVRRSDEGPGPSAAGDVEIVRRGRFTRAAQIAGLAITILLVIAIAVVWVQRKPIATHFIRTELERRGVQATYDIDRVGFRTQEVSNLVIGDPKRPDLVARYAQIQTRLKLNGSFEVYRIVARGVRLRGRLVGGKVRWGEVDKLLPPPSNKPFRLPDFALDVADSTISLATPFGPVGIALNGSGKLSGGFVGRAALSSPKVDVGRCVAQQLRANMRVQVIARRPNFVGPVRLAALNCPTSRFIVDQPRFDAKASFNESFTEVDGAGRMAIQSLVAGANGLANFIGDLSYKGPLEDVRGHVRLSAQKSRLATIYADRTRLDGRYGLGLRNGRLALVGKFAADSARLDQSMLAAVQGPLAAAGKTPIGPVATTIAQALFRTSNNFNIAGDLRVVNFPGGGGARINQANIIGPQGARAHIFGGTGVTYYWPAGGLRIDGTIDMAGGGLPQGRVILAQARPGAPVNGMAKFAPYIAKGSRLTLAPIRFAGAADGSTRVSTAVQLDGPFPDGRVQALRFPIEGRVGPGGAFALGTSCAVVGFEFAQFGSLALNRTRLPVCPIGGAIVAKRDGGPVSASARISSTVLNGRLGKSPFRLATSAGRFVGQEFALDRVAARLGQADPPILFNSARLTGTFAGGGISGRFADGSGTIGRVPLALSEGNGRWKLYHGNLTVDSAATISDRLDNPRFYPLRSDDLHLTIAGDLVRATGTLRHPSSGTRVVDVNIEHRLSADAGHAVLNVPALTFGPALQPDELTRLTQGVIALVNGTITGSGRIDWNRTGKVTSTGDFSTADLDLAAPFGPVEGISGTMHFSDLLGLTTDPGQVLAIQSINPGILVENGTVRYQLLPGQLVRIERGQWPFMGGTLILRETVLDFSRPTAKHLTFEVVGLDAKVFVDSLGFKEIAATGKFDGVLPMIFDENGGRIVGGELNSRDPGGSLSYVGTLNAANLGTMGKVAFDALRDLRFRQMTIRLDGDLAGEFSTRLTVNQLGLSGSTGAAKLIRGAFAKVPFRFNINIRGPFRSLIQMAKSIRDPRQQINDILPRPLDDIPGITTELRRREEDQQQTQTPVDQQVTVTPPPVIKK